MTTEDDIARILAGHFASRPWLEMAEDKADLRKKVRKPWSEFDVNEATKEDCVHAAQDVLSALA